MLEREEGNYTFQKKLKIETTVFSDTLGISLFHKGHRLLYSK